MRTNTSYILAHHGFTISSPVGNISFLWLPNFHPCDCQAYWRGDQVQSAIDIMNICQSTLSLTHAASQNSLIYTLYKQTLHAQVCNDCILPFSKPHIEKNMLERALELLWLSVLSLLSIVWWRDVWLYSCIDGWLTDADITYCWKGTVQVSSYRRSSNQMEASTVFFSMKTLTMM